MTQEERRKKIRRRIEAAHANPQDNRRREIDRRGKTPDRLAEKLQDDRRRFEETGSE